MAPSVRGYMLDTLLFQPEISPKVESYIEDKIYEAVEEFEKMGHTSYRQDLGSSVHKFSTAISRLHLSNNVTKQDVDNGMEAWKNMYHGSMIIHRVDTNTKRMNRISDEGRLFYTELCKVFGSGTNITIDDIPQNTSIPTWKIDTVLQELGRASLIYFLPNENNSIRIIDFGVFK